LNITLNLVYNCTQTCERSADVLLSCVSTELKRIQQYAGTVCLTYTRLHSDTIQYNFICKAHLKQPWFAKVLNTEIIPDKILKHMTKAQDTINQ